MFTTPSTPPQVSVFRSAETACHALAARIATSIRERAQEGRSYVLGLATGSSPMPLYQKLIRLHQEEGLSFRNVHCFNLDEYYSLPREDPNSYYSFMRQHLFDAIDIPKNQWQIPRGDTPRELVTQHCSEYEEAVSQAGGIDLQILGIGRTGHIGFNEPPSNQETTTRLVSLNIITREDAREAFGGIENVPTEAITMGVANILQAREIVLLAWGAGKADIVARALAEAPTETIPATYLNTHSQASIILDQDAATNLPK